MFRLNSEGQFEFRDVLIPDTSDELADYKQCWNVTQSEGFSHCIVFNLTLTSHGASTSLGFNAVSHRKLFSSVLSRFSGNIPTNQV